MSAMPTQAQIAELLEEAVARFKAPGASFAMFHDGQLYATAAGVLNVDSGQRATAGSMYQIGSITKVFTATLVMQLVDEGRLDLDKPIVEYLPDFMCADREAREAITARHLLSHTSGLDGDFITDTGFGEDALRRYIDRCALLPQLHVPGKAISYCNSGYGIAGRIVEVLRGRSWDQEISTRIFAPLRMRNAATWPAALVAREVAAAHSFDAKSGKNVFQGSNYGLPISLAPAGSTATISATDLLTFVRAHLAGGSAADGARMLSTEACAAMTQRQVSVPLLMRDIVGWGLGWFLAEWGDQSLIGHDGGTSGQASFLRVHSKSGTIAALLTNGGMAQDLMQFVFEETFGRAIEAKMPRPPQPSATQPKNLARYEGTYRTVGGTTRIAIENERLIRHHYFAVDAYKVESPPVPLEHISDDTFLFRQGATEIPSVLAFLDPDPQGRPAILFSGLR
jgi:CubicO group peptidase (beta-lactamase class C family)